MDAKTLTEAEIDYYIKQYALRIADGIALDDSKQMLDYLFVERNERKRCREQEEYSYQCDVKRRAVEQGADPNTFINNETINLGSEPII